MSSLLGIGLDCCRFMVGRYDELSAGLFTSCFCMSIFHVLWLGMLFNWFYCMFICDAGKVFVSSSGLAI